MTDAPDDVPQLIDQYLDVKNTYPAVANKELLAFTDDTPREVIVEALIAQGCTPADADYIYEHQVKPQLLTEHIRRIDPTAEIALVNVDTDAPGFEVKCSGCKRTARLPFQPSEDKLLLCPACQRNKVQPALNRAERRRRH